VREDNGHQKPTPISLAKEKLRAFMAGVWIKKVK
jgi:hypothetical protein